MSELLFGGYTLAVFGAGLLGAWLPRLFEMSHTRTQLTMSFVAGLMLGVAFLHLIPHSAMSVDMGLDATMLCVVAGLAFMLFLIRLFNVHQHSLDPLTVHEGGDPALETDQVHAYTQHHDHTPAGSGFSWVGLVGGLSVHSVVDGIALGAVMGAGASGSGSMLGVSVFLVILLHKPLDSLSIETVMASRGASDATRRFVNVAFAALCPLAAWLFWLIVDPGAVSGVLLPMALGLSAGAFICIALADLLPEIQFHSHDRLMLTGLFCLGIGLAYFIGVFEPAHGDMAHLH